MHKFDHACKSPASTSSSCECYYGRETGESLLIIAYEHECKNQIKRNMRDLASLHLISGPYHKVNTWQQCISSCIKSWKDFFIEEELNRRWLVTLEHSPFQTVLSVWSAAPSCWLDRVNRDQREQIQSFHLLTF